MLSAGMPMMLMGDEVRRTQRGNNNAYCQDNETSWFDWDLVAARSDVRRFVSLLNSSRVARDVEHEELRVSLSQLIRQTDVTWHGVRLYEPDWSDASHSIAFTSRFVHRRMVFHAMFNAYWEALEFELPPVVDSARDRWRRWIDTFLESPHDVVDWNHAPIVSGSTYRAEPRCVVVLFAPIGAKEV
jgi:glycogen operon protein